MTKNFNSSPGGGEVDADNVSRRLLAGAPFALIITTGLGLLMAGLIKVDYLISNEKPEPLSFIINEPVPDIAPPKRGDPPEKPVVTPPPPPPVIDTIKSENPKIPPITYDSDLPPPLKPHVELEQPVILVADRNPQPILRMPPTMPPRFTQGNNSGHCTVRFDVSAQGSPYNVVATYCSAKILERPTVKSVLKWKFNPKIRGGQAVAMTGLRNTVKFNLLDEKGQLLPEI